MRRGPGQGRPFHRGRDSGHPLTHHRYGRGIEGQDDSARARHPVRLGDGEHGGRVGVLRVEAGQSVRMQVDDLHNCPLLQR